MVFSYPIGELRSRYRDADALVSYLQNLYSRGCTATVAVSGEEVTVTLGGFSNGDVESAVGACTADIDRVPDTGLAALAPSVDACVERFPSVAEAHTLKAWFLWNMMDGAGAVDECIEALRLNPTDVGALFILGRDMMVRGRSDDAAAMFRRALSFAPRNAREMNMHAFMLLYTGRPQEARSLLDADRRSWNALGYYTSAYIRRYAEGVGASFQDALASTVVRPRFGCRLRQECSSYLTESAVVISDTQDITASYDDFLDCFVRTTGTMLRMEEDAEQECCARVSRIDTGCRTVTVTVNPTMKMWRYSVIEELSGLMSHLCSLSQGFMDKLSVTGEGFTNFESDSRDFLSRYSGDENEYIFNMFGILEHIFDVDLTCVCNAFWLFHNYPELRPMQLTAFLSRWQMRGQAENLFFLPERLQRLVRIVLLVSFQTYDYLYGLGLTFDGIFTNEEERTGRRFLKPFFQSMKRDLPSARTMFEFKQTLLEEFGIDRYMELKQ